MQQWLFALALGLSFLSGPAVAQDREQAAVIDSIQAFTEAVNRGDFTGALAHFTADPVITEDLAPYRFSGSDAGRRWIDAMGANAAAHEIAVIDMKLSTATRVDVSADHAYAIVPGKLTFTTKDVHQQSAAGTLTFALEQSGGGWKISTLTWAGLPPR